MVLPVRIELTTSPLPRGCSTTELRQRCACGRGQGNTRGPGAWQGRWPVCALAPCGALGRAMEPPRDPPCFTPRTHVLSVAEGEGATMLPRLRCSFRRGR